MIQSHKKIAFWLLSGCFLVFLMVIIGGITRATGSGLSITEWNIVTGTFPPLNEQDWLGTFDKYKHSPQFLLLNAGFGLNEFKSIFWWEYVHRLLGRVIGLTFLLPFFYFLFTKQIQAPLRKKLLFLLALGTLQGFLGWFMVKSGLVNLPQVSHYRLAIHLVMAFLIFGFAFHLALGLLYPVQKQTLSRVRKIENAAWAIFFLSLLQIIYGALVAGLHGGTVYNTFPKMGSGWVPPEVTSLFPSWKNLTENLVTVQFIHRCMAWLLLLLAGLLWFFSTKSKALSAPQTKAVHVFLFLLTLQFSLGILTLLSSVILPLAILHQAGAFFLFAGILHLLHRLRETGDIQKPSDSIMIGF